jgi:predicted regulator of Ras-like GTPase activity (Roadblock/LC7/MglB family)
VNDKLARMDLTEPLKTLVASVPGAVGAVLLDNEGEAVTYFTAPEETERIRLIAAYHRIWLNDCLALSERLQVGQLDHLVQIYEAGTVLVKAMPGKHAIALIGTTEMIVGQGLWQLNQTGKLIAEDL